MLKKYIIVIEALVLSLVVMGRELTLDQALQIAVEGNPDLRIKELELKKKELEIAKSKKDFLPILTAGDSYDLRENDNNMSLGASLPLYTGGRLSNRLELSKLDHQVEISEAELLKLGIRERVILKYFEILNIEKQIEIADVVLESLNKQRKRLNSLYEGGKLIPKSELLKVELDILTTETSKLREKNEREIAKYELKILLGVGLDEEISLKEFDYLGVDLDRYNLEEEMKAALAGGNRAEIEEVRLREANLEKELAKAEFKPDVSLDWTYNRIDRAEDSDFDDDTGWVLSLRASWELFSWGSSIDNLRQSEYLVEQAVVDHDRNMDEIRLDIRQKYREMRILYMEVEASEKNLALSKENLKIDTLRYDASIISSIDYLVAIDRLKRAEEGYYLLQSNLLLAIDQYENSLK